MTVEESQRAEIASARAEVQTTRRATVAGLEEVLFEALPVLDHGFVRVVDYMGDDSAVVQAARVSYGKGTKQTRQDRGLIRYLMRHRHTTPFEMCEIKLHVKLPIFVARQWIRHRTANVNEYSARYSVLDREFYVPAVEQLSVQSESNKQGREQDALAPEQAQRVLELLRDDASRCYDNYERLMSDHQLARELARMNLPVSIYTQWYWKIDLLNLLHFLSLRMDPHAQFEIRVYAEVIGDVVSRWVPLVWEAFTDYRREGTVLSRGEIAAVKALIAGEQPNLKELGLSKRERREFAAKFGLPEPD